MIETDSQHHPVVVDDLDEDWLLSLCEEAETQARVADRRRLRYALRWAHLHPASAEEVARDRVEPVGGEGTPHVAELSTEEFATAMGMSTHAGLALISDALDLAHRLPRVRSRVEALEIPAWRARRIAQATSGLSARVATIVDREIAPVAGRCGFATIDRIVAEAAAAVDPEAQEQDEEDARARWDVQLFHPPVTGPGRWVGTSVLQITGDTADLTDLYHRINEAAVRAGREGDAAPIGVRRSVAAARLLGAGTGSSRPRVRLYLHATMTDLLDETVDPSDAAGWVERLGPLTLARIREWCAGAAVTVVPVLRTASSRVVDRHDPPYALREEVVLRDGHCVFPGCQTDARSCDLDHIEPYVPVEEGGPPGQTSATNLACLCRRHHRLKTRRRWSYRRLPDGRYEWRGPQGQTLEVTARGATPTRPPSAARDRRSPRSASR